MLSDLDLIWEVFKVKVKRRERQKKEKWIYSPA